jgi:hypothetical protein
MAAYTAATCNPFIFAHVQEPHGRCKPFKCALVAAMRPPSFLFNFSFHFS